MRPLRGITYKICSVLLFIVMASLIKAAHVPPGQAVFFRSFFAIPVIVGWLAYQKELTTGFRTANPMGHVWRGLSTISTPVRPRMTEPMRKARTVSPRNIAARMTTIRGEA